MSITRISAAIALILTLSACTRCGPATMEEAGPDAAGKLITPAVNFPVNGRSPWQPGGIEGAGFPTPKQHFGSSLLFEFNPGLAASVSPLLTVSGGNITQALDAAGGSLVFANAATAGYGTASPLNGRAYLAAGFSNTLYTATGGVTGRNPLTQWAIVRWNQISAQTNCSIIGAGIRGGNSINLGAIPSSSELWSGYVSEPSAPVAALTTEPLYGGASGSATPLTMLVMSGFDGTNTQIYVDGHASTGGLAAGPPIGSTQFGFFRWYFPAGDGTCQDVDVFDSGWVSAVPATSDLQYLTKYARSLLGLSGYPQTQAQIQWEGDSIMLGIAHGADPGDDSPHVAQGLISPATTINVTAVGGSQWTDIASRVTADIAFRGYRRRQDVIVAAGCFNDYFTGGQTAAQVIATMQTVTTAWKAAGFTVVLGTCTPYAQGGYGPGTAFDNYRVAINTWIMGPAVSGGYAAAASNRDSEYALLADPVHYQTSPPHFNDAGYAVIGGVDAPVVQGVLQGMPPASVFVLLLADGIALVLRKRRSANNNNNAEADAA
jgi:hypothetical protein